MKVGSSAGWKPWVVCLSAALFFFYGFMQVNIFNALDPELYRAFHLANSVQLGNLAAMYFYASVIFLFPAGILLDHFSTRRLILIALAIMIVSVAAFALSHNFWEGLICRFFTGMGGSFCLLSCMRLASRWFPAQRMALISGFIVTLAMLGGMIAQTPITLLTDHYGWRSMLWCNVAFGLVVWWIIFIIVQDSPDAKERDVIQDHAHLSELGFWHSLALALRNKQNWFGGIYTSTMNLPLMLLGTTWGSLYLVQIYHLTRAQASIVTTMLFAGLIFGSPAWGWVSDRLRQRKLPMIVGAVLAMPIILIIMYGAQLSLTMLIITFFMLGFVTSSQIITYPLVIESNSRALTGTAQGITSILVIAGGFVIPVFSWLLNLRWNHAMYSAFPLYSIQNYHMAFAVMPIGFIISLLTSFLIKETSCRFTNE